MARRFPQPATPSTTLASPACSIIGSTPALYLFPVEKDGFHTFVTGDAATVYRTRSATTGTSYNSTEGQVETTVDSDQFFDIPADLFTVPSGGPFTIVLFLERDVTGGGGGSTRNLMSATDGTWGVYLETSPGGTTTWVNANNTGTFWNVAAVNSWDSAVGEHIIIYRHTDGAQKMQVNSTVKGSPTDATPVAGKTMGSASYPFRFPTGFFNASNRKTFFKGGIVVSGALSDTVIGNLVGASGQIVSAGTPPSAPSAPTSPATSSITATTVTASWTDASSNEDSFEVQTSPSPYSTWTTAPASPAAANATSLGITGLTGSTTYKFRVRSTNAGGSSAWVESSPFTTSVATVRKLRLLAQTDLVGATAVKGAVFAAPISGNLTGAKIGEFTGGAFGGTAVGSPAAAELKVAVSAFGGGSLLTSDTPVAIIECTTAAGSPLGNAVAVGSGGVFECTVIDE